MVTADEEQGPDELDHLNRIGVSATAPGGYEGTAGAEDTLTTIKKRLAVEAGKQVTPDEIIGSAGEYVTARLSGHLLPFPDSTTRANEIVVTDQMSQGWYENFRPTQLTATPVPMNSTLTVQWYDGSDWHDVDGMVDLEGGVHSAPFPAEVPVRGAGRVCRPR